LTITGLEYQDIVAGGIWWRLQPELCLHQEQKKRHVLVPKHERKKVKEHLGKAEAAELVSDAGCGICYLNGGMEQSKESRKSSNELRLEN